MTTAELKQMLIVTISQVQADCGADDTPIDGATIVSKTKGFDSQRAAMVAADVEAQIAAILGVEEFHIPDEWVGLSVDEFATAILGRIQATKRNT